MKMVSRMVACMILWSLYSCFEVVSLDVPKAPEESFPFVEVIYNSNTGWQTVFDQTKTLNEVHTDTVQLEYFTLYEDNVAVYTWTEDMPGDVAIDYIPRPGSPYHISVKIRGWDEIESDVQMMYPKPVLDSCYVLDDIIVCRWKNQDPGAGYFIQHSRNSEFGSYTPRPDIIRNTGTELPEIMSYTFAIPLRDTTIKIALSRLSEGLIAFYDSLEKYQHTYDDGTTDPGWIYSNLSAGYGIFGLISQSDSLSLDIR